MPHRKVLDVLHPLTCWRLWSAEITRRRCEPCLPYLLDKAGGLQENTLDGFPWSSGEAKTSMQGMQADQT